MTNQTCRFCAAPPIANGCCTHHARAGSIADAETALGAAREAARLAALHEAGGEIVGGWHTHPQWLPVPSAQDLSEWRRVLLAEAESETASPYRVEVIVGTVHVRAWVGAVGLPLVHPMRAFDPYAEEAKAS